MAGHVLDRLAYAAIGAVIGALLGGVVWVLYGLGLSPRWGGAGVPELNGPRVVGDVAARMWWRS
jgi:hypothetical protein